VRLVLDLQCSQSPAHADRGIARYAIELASALQRAGADLALLTLNPALPFPRSLPPELLAHPGLGWTSPQAYDQLEGEVAHLVLSPMEEVAPGSVLPPHIRANGAHVVALLFDLIPLVLRERYFSGGVWARYRQRLELYRHADLVLAISEHTRRDALTHLGLADRRVVTVLGGVSSYFCPRPAAEQQRASDLVPGLKGRHVLTVGGGDSRKNLDGLVRAWALVPREVRAGHQLVLACHLHPPSVNHLRVLADDAGLADDELVLTGYVSDRALRELYRDAALFVFPSSYEGLGLPVLEALACGCPAITSDRSSMPEILDLASSTFDPDDPAEMARCITAGLVGDALRSTITARGRERLAGFTWDATAGRVLDALKGLPGPVAAGVPGRSRRRTRRLALVTPLPPSSSVVATVSRRLLPELARRVEVVVLDPEARPSPDGSAGVRVVPLRSLGRGLAAESFDHLVSVVGNSGHHWPTAEAVQRSGGIVWLHDAHLPAINTERAKLLGLPATSTAEIDQALHPGRGLRPGDVAWGDPDELAGKGVNLTGQVVRWARGCIVTSELAARLLALDQQPGQAVPPAAVLPLPFADPASIGDLGPDEPPLLLAPCHPGALGASGVLVEALGLLRREVPARLAFVGPTTPTMRAWVGALSERWGVAGAVDVVGPVDDTTWWRWVRRARVGVVLGGTAAGVSLGAVRDLVSAGVACVTNRAGSIDLPPGTTLVLPHSAGPESIAQLLAGLLAEPSQGDELAIAGRAIAAGWTYAHLAEALLPTLDALAAAAAPRLGAHLVSEGSLLRHL